MDSIRSRLSYRRFHEFARFLSTDRDPAEILLQVHALLDEWQAFRSRQGSCQALESVHAVIQDFGWASPDTVALPPAPSDPQ